MKKYNAETIEGTLHGTDHFQEMVTTLQERIETEIKHGGKKTFEAFTTVYHEDSDTLIHTYHVQWYVWVSLDCEGN
jgi:hypothetical protein